MLHSDPVPAIQGGRSGSYCSVTGSGEVWADSENVGILILYTFKYRIRLIRAGIGSNALVLPCRPILVFPGYCRAQRFSSDRSFVLHSECPVLRWEWLCYKYLGGKWWKKTFNLLKTCSCVLIRILMFLSVLFSVWYSCYSYKSNRLSGTFWLG